MAPEPQKAGFFPFQNISPISILQADFVTPEDNIHYGNYEVHCLQADFVTPEDNIHHGNYKIYCLLQYNVSIVESVSESESESVSES